QSRRTSVHSANMLTTAQPEPFSSRSVGDLAHHYLHGSRRSGQAELWPRQCPWVHRKRASPAEICPLSDNPVCHSKGAKDGALPFSGLPNTRSGVIVSTSALEESGRCVMPSPIRRLLKGQRPSVKASLS